jgi:hypothetical protein
MAMPAHIFIFLPYLAMLRSSWLEPAKASVAKARDVSLNWGQATHLKDAVQQSATSLNTSFVQREQHKHDEMREACVFMRLPRPEHKRIRPLRHCHLGESEDGSGGEWWQRGCKWPLGTA